MTANLPPVGALAMRRIVIHPARRPIVWRVVAVIGRVATSAGVIVSPSPVIVLASAVGGERIKVRACDFARDWQWEIVQ